MKRAVFILVLGVILGGLAGAGVYFHRTAPERAMLCCQNPELAWLQQQYHLTDAQLARVQKLDASYHAACAEMCQRIAATNDLVRTEFASRPAATRELRELLTNAAQLRAECQWNMLGYCQAVSREMAPDQGQRYLQWVSGQVLNMPATMPMPDSSGHGN